MQQQRQTEYSLLEEDDGLYEDNRSKLNDDNRSSRSAISYVTRNVFVGFSAAALGGLLFGYIIGVNSGIVTTGSLLCDKDDDSSKIPASYTKIGYDSCYDLSDNEKGCLTSLNLVGALISTLYCFKYGDSMGRHAELTVASVLYTLGACIAAFAPNLIIIMIGLFVYGTGIGFAMHAAPVYIAEIAHEKSRGLLVSCKEAIIVVGMLLGYFVSFIFQNLPHYNWRVMILFACVFSVCLGFFISTQKRSPRWLAIKTCTSVEYTKHDVMDSLRHFRSNASESELIKECDEIFETVEECKSCDIDQESGQVVVCKNATEQSKSMSSSSSSGIFSLLTEYRLALTIGCGLVILQQVTGQPSVLYYANNIFKSAGFGDNAAICSVIVALVKLIATVFSVLRVDRYGRRTMLLVGISMMLFALIILAIGFRQQYCTTDGVSVSDCDSDDLSVPSTWGFATVLALMVYVSGYQVGFGPVSWLVISEIFPLRVRSSAFSVAAASNFASNIAVAFLFSSLQTWLTTSGAYFLYAGMSILSLIFVIFVVPETKGKTLEQIETLLGYRK